MSKLDPARRAVLERRYTRLSHANAVVAVFYEIAVVLTVSRMQFKAWNDFLLPGFLFVAGLALLAGTYAPWLRMRSASRSVGQTICALVTGLSFAAGCVTLSFANDDPRSAGTCLALLIAAVAFVPGLLLAIVDRLDRRLHPPAPGRPPPAPDDLEGKDIQKWDEAS
ncbi:MAG: hypothetical protein ACREJ2_00345 [Planctomycetota bacterium]